MDTIYHIIVVFLQHAWAFHPIMVIPAIIAVIVVAAIAAVPVLFYIAFSIVLPAWLAVIATVVIIVYAAVNA